ncbi:hypothetical protein RclHR1_21190002 [Rhizophagus clarus]|uniref:Uncharacterized protein n=1 Tax=Rhizophagus clarus TaxID=94130 RepID=A0A2Z6R5Q2_9GLOM|nr:hypothetical protein RclHR1_21190002 [Rhizophagus clarus]GES96013.1 hypothetical protein GLOIN_2v1480197 [Rhizophagus clarus]
MGLNKIKYIKSYSATSISKLTNEQIQEVIDYGISSEKLPLVTDHVTEISETLCPRKNLPENASDQNNVLEVLSLAKLTSTAPIPLAHVFAKHLNGNFSGDPKGINPESSPKAEVNIPSKPITKKTVSNKT